MISLAVLVSLPAMVIIFVQERAGEHLLSWTLRNNYMILVVLFSLLTGVKSGILNVTGPI